VDLGSRLVCGKEMRRGYTTGSCAAAAAKAAVAMLFSAQIPERVSIMTPAGIALDLQVEDAQLSLGSASCAIRKDAGDDPDLTNGLKIYAEVRPGAEGIEIYGGPGVGTVTRAGLAVAVGQPAINPVPRRMILDEVRQVLPSGAGVQITISIPGGAEVACRTFNPRLGISGGLSILGTTGIVEPMSAEAWQESIRLELQVLSAQGRQRVILVPGNYGEHFVRDRLRLAAVPVVKMSNYVGYTLEACVHLGFQEILLVGDLGKLIKVAGGIFNTHSQVADARLEISAAIAALLGAAQPVIQELLSLPTTGAVLDLLERERLREPFCREAAQRVTERALQHLRHRAALGTVLFANNKGLLAVDSRGEELLERFRQ